MLLTSVSSSMTRHTLLIILLSVVSCLSTFWQPAICIMLYIVSATLLVHAEAPQKFTPVRVAVSLLRGFFAMLVGTAFYFGLILLLGASLIEGVPETLSLSVHLAACTCVPTALVNTNDAVGLKRVAKQLRFRPTRDIDTINMYASCAMVVLSLCCALVLPLDWDVWWQKWPIPCVVGANVGFMCGIFYVITHLTSLGKPSAHRI